ncbi:MAG: hypothetical protein C5B52_01705 [Bacteroidetes bacterium]|nr:MAG: hypothetical protein C5B52_01705 [Bacteroidota bacterium]
MNTLISKVQYKDFEPGEFVDVQERDFDSTIQLIENFPWQSQKEKIIIDLTNPSITIEGKNNDYLKFAVFFNQKYVLHYFDSSHQLYSKSFGNLKDSFNYIRNLFEQKSFSTEELKKEPTWFQHNLKHFVTQDFRYFVTPQSARKYLIKTSGLNIFFSILFIAAFISPRSNFISPLGISAFILVMTTLGGGLNWIMFYQYYQYCKDKILIMSRGNDSFYFGLIPSPIAYDKKDILQYTIIRPANARHLLRGFSIVEIEFKNGTMIKIPNLVVDVPALERKLFQYPQIQRNKIPFLRR